jgi:hypothetical protein
MPSDVRPTAGELPGAERTGGTGGQIAKILWLPQYKLTYHLILGIMLHLVRDSRSGIPVPLLASGGRRCSVLLIRQLTVDLASGLRFRAAQVKGLHAESLRPDLYPLFAVSRRKGSYRICGILATLIAGKVVEQHSTSGPARVYYW